MPSARRSKLCLVLSRKPTVKPRRSRGNAGIAIAPALSAATGLSTVIVGMAPPVIPLGISAHGRATPNRRGDPSRRARSSYRIDAIGDGGTRLATPRIRHTEETSPMLGDLRSEEHTSELQSLRHLVCRLLLEK